MSIGNSHLISVKPVSWRPKWTQLHSAMQELTSFPVWAEQYYTTPLQPYPFYIIVMHFPSGPTVLSITLVYPASFWPKLLLLIHDGCLSSFVRMVSMQPLSQLSKCCRSRKCIQWYIPVRAIFAIFYLFFYQFYQGHLGLQTMTKRQRTHLLSARSSAITRRHLQAPWWLLLCMLLVSAHKKCLVQYVLVPIFLCCSTILWLELSFSIEQFPSYTASKIRKCQ